jgi:fatty acid desaturase
MPSFTQVRRSPWLVGALLLMLAAGLAAPVVSVFGWRRWPLYAGLVAVTLLLFGGVERLWQRRALPSPRRAAKRGRFRLVPGGKRKGNGESHDSDPEGDGDKPRWVM